MGDFVKPYHLFYRGGKAYLINIDNMEATMVPGQVVRDLTTKEWEILDGSLEEELRHLGLLCEEKSPGKKGVPEPPSITSMSLFLTQSCNLRCIYCYGDGGTYGRKGDMEKKTALSAVDWLIENSGEMKNIAINFFGGEPFLKFALMKEVVEYAKKITDKRVSFSAITNATLLNGEMMDFIEKEDMTIVVSIDGPREIHDAQRIFPNGEGSYDWALPKIKELLQRAEVVRGHAVVLGDTDPELVKDTLYTMGFREVVLSPVSRSFYTQTRNETKIIRNNTELINDLETQAEQWLHAIQARDVSTLKVLMGNSMLYQGILFLLNNRKRFYPCSAGVWMVAVSSVGDIYLCHRFVGQENFKLGNIHEKGLRRKKYLESPAKNNDKCVDCFARFFCAGGCKYDNLIYCGSTNTPVEDVCRLRRHELEISATIVSGLSEQDTAFLIEEDIFPPRPCPLDF